jgi:pimeloyl-ACP methyl ester carboxylesterase
MPSGDQAGRQPSRTPAADRYFTVVAPDLPGIGGSSVPRDGLDMASAARRVHTLIQQLGVGRAAVVGHDIGLMVAYAYAAQFPNDVERLVTALAASAGAGAASAAVREMRLTPAEVRGNQTGTEQIGSSFLPGVSTKVLAGDPSRIASLRLSILDDAPGAVRRSASAPVGATRRHANIVCRMPRANARMAAGLIGR